MTTYGVHVYIIILFFFIYSFIFFHDKNAYSVCLRSSVFVLYVCCSVLGNANVCSGLGDGSPKVFLNHPT